MKKMAFLFSGQGAQYPGMMKELYDTNYKCKEVFEKANRALSRDITNLIFNGTREELNLTRNTQPCMLVADLAAYYAVVDVDIKPDVVAGFSLGEFGALVATGAIEMEDAFRLIQIRADAIQETVPVGEGGMAAVIGCPQAEVEELCRQVNGYIIPANYNCPGQIVVSGEMQSINELLSKAKAKKIRAMKLDVSAPFHCNLVRPAADVLLRAMDNLEILPGNIPIYSNVTGCRLGEHDIKDELYRQVFSPVQWQKTLENMWIEGVDTFIEIGPGNTLTKFVKNTLKEARAFHVEDLATKTELMNALLKETHYGTF